MQLRNAIEIAIWAAVWAQRPSGQPVYVISDVGVAKRADAAVEAWRQYRTEQMADERAKEEWGKHDG